MKPLGASGRTFSVRFVKLRAAHLTQPSISHSPVRSDKNATNFPSGEFSAPSSVPSQSVKRLNSALASGSTGATGRAASQIPTPAASATNANQGNHPARIFPVAARAAVARGARAVRRRPRRVRSATSPMSRTRCLRFFARQRGKSRRTEVQLPLAMRTTPDHGEESRQSCRTPCRRGTRDEPSAFRRGHTRRPRCLCACQLATTARMLGLM